MRRMIFLSDDGVVLCATLRALDELGVLEPSLEAERSLDELYPELRPTGFGYLRAGLRTLASQGWLAEQPSLDPKDAVIRWTRAGRLAGSAHSHYVAVGRFLAGFDRGGGESWREWGDDRVRSFLGLLEPCVDRWPLSAELPAELGDVTRIHLDAGLAVPALLLLRGTGGLAENGPRLPPGPLGGGIERLLSTLGWLDPEGRWTEDGGQARAYAIHFGIVGSYLPMLSRLPELYRGEMTVPSASDGEWHVDRELNVLASAAAHRRYFADADGIFIDLFNREPVSQQPGFIADMGCGDGSWLVHLYNLTRDQTARGEHLGDVPLLMVGIDCNATALEAARRRLDEAGVPGLLVFGDVGDPDSLRDTLRDHGLAIEDGLHVRSFLDHDRTYQGADPAIPVPGTSSGAYVDGQGSPLSGVEVERDLVAHLRRWAPYVRRHGLVALEAHCVAPTIAREHLGALHSVAFDSYHAYSHQYPVEHSSFIRSARQAGLERLSHDERHYPSSRPFVAVSLNRFLSSESGLPAMGARIAREDSWQPGPDLDLEDGDSLHRLLFTDGDLRYPRLWCAAPTGFVVAGTLAAIEEKLAGAPAGDVIRVLDYGTGSGLAAIELLKACHECGMEGRLQRAGVELEVHLADLPTAWFAKGFELLSECGWTRFHSLRTDDGGFRPLREVSGGREMDAVMSNMVFHLIPPSALESLAAELAVVLAPGGRLLWSSPDLGPPGPHATLFHDPNRALRKRWLELLDGSPATLVSRNGEKQLSPELSKTIADLRGRLDSDARREAQARADRRILPRAHASEEIEGALKTHLGGEAQRRTYEMLGEEIIDALLVPSNQAEYFPEIPETARREQAITELMLDEILPAMQATPAGTALGLNVQWTLGDFAAPAPGARPA